MMTLVIHHYYNESGKDRIFTQVKWRRLSLALRLMVFQESSGIYEARSEILNLLKVIPLRMMTEQ